MNQLDLTALHLCVKLEDKYGKSELLTASCASR
jgi:hypothetical protein